MLQVYVIIKETIKHQNRIHRTSYVNGPGTIKDVQLWLWTFVNRQTMRVAMASHSRVSQLARRAQTPHTKNPASIQNRIHRITGLFKVNVSQHRVGDSYQAPE